MSVKEHMCSAIVFLLTSAVLCFLMIILVGLARTHNLNNKVNDRVTIQSVDYGRWGQIPGNYSVDYQRNVTAYTLSMSSTDNTNKEATVEKQSRQGYQISRDFYKPEWSPTKSIIEYTESYVYDSLTTSDWTEPKETVNFAALSTWYQLTHKPRYWYSWSALMSISNMMYQTLDILNISYAYNAYQYVFNDYAKVQVAVLADFSADD